MPSKKILFFLFLSINLRLSAQEVSSRYTLDKQEKIFQHYHLGVAFTTYITQKATIEKIEGDYILGSSAQPGGELGIVYNYNLNTKNSICTGIKIGLLANNYLFTVKKDDFVPAAPFDYDVSFPGDLNISYLSVPLTYNHRVFLKNEKHFIEILAGINIRASLKNEIQFYSQVGNDKIVSLDLNQESKIWINYNFGANHSWIFKNNDILNMGLLFNFSGTSIADSNYSITIPGRETAFGNYDVKGSYIGLQCTYLFTACKKKM